MATGILNVYGPVSYPVAADDNVLQGGDSIQALDTNTQVPGILKRRWLTARARRRGVAGGRWKNPAVSSTGVVAELARVNTAIAQYGPTKYIAILGTADWIVSTPIGTYTPAFNGILDALCGGLGIPVCIFGPTLLGEKWFDGQNANDSLGDQYIAAMIAGVARYPGLATFVDMRATLYTPFEPANNVANTSSGPLTRPDGVFAHFNQGGRGIYDLAIGKVIQIVDAVARPAYALSVPPNVGSLVSWKVAADIGQADGSSVTAWADRISQIGTNPAGAFNSTITPATKPVFKTPGQAGKNNNRPAVQSAGSTYMQSTSLLTAPIAQPYMIGMVWQHVNLTGNQIILDSTPATSVNVPTINASGLLQPAAPTPYTPYPAPNVAAASWNAAVIVFNGLYSYVIFNGVRSNLGNVGTNPIDREFIFASATGPGGLPFTGMLDEKLIWASSAGPLPDARDAYQYLLNVHGGYFPQ